MLTLSIILVVGPCRLFLTSSPCRQPLRSACDHGHANRFHVRLSAQQPTVFINLRCPSIISGSSSKVGFIEPRYHRELGKGGPTRCPSEQLHVHWPSGRSHQGLQLVAALPSLSSVCHGRAIKPVYLRGSIRHQQGLFAFSPVSAELSRGSYYLAPGPLLTLSYRSSYKATSITKGSSPHDSIGDGPMLRSPNPNSRSPQAPARIWRSSSTSILATTSRRH